MISGRVLIGHLRGAVQRGLLVAVGEVHVGDAGPGLQQHPHQLPVARPGRQVQGRGPGLVHAVTRGLQHRECSREFSALQ